MTRHEIHDDVINSDTLTERRDELREMRKPWLAGYNMPGYMPDNEPTTFEDWESARDYLAEEIANGMDDELAEAIDAETILAHWQADAECGERFGAYYFWISRADNDGLDEAEADELAELEKICDDGEKNFDDWEHGISLVADYHFTDYARELLEDCGDLPANLPWYIKIDWAETAHNIRMDYTPVEIFGRTYWGR